MRLLLGCALGLVLLAAEIGGKRVDGACPVDSLPCDDGEECVKRDEWCDGSAHCQDKSDEAYCKKKSKWLFGDPDPNKCEATHFLCGDGRCVPLVAKCDDHYDCKDKSDEGSVCDPTEDYVTEPEITSTESTTIETFSEISEEVDSPTTPDTPIFLQTTSEPYTESKEESDTDETTPVVTTNIPLRISSTPMNFYAKRLEEETARESSHLTDLTTPYTLLTTTQIKNYPLEHRNPLAQTQTTTLQPLSSFANTPISSPISDVHYIYAQTTSVQPTPSHDSRPYSPLSQIPPIHPSDPRRLPEQSRSSISNPTRAYVPAQNSYQYNTPIPFDSRRDTYLQRTIPTYDHRRPPYGHTTQSTRIYESRGYPHQYYSQPPKPYDSRQDPNRYQTQAPRPHDSRRDPDRYQTQAPRPHDSRLDPNRYQTQAPRPHDSRRDPDRYQTQAPRPHDSRRDPDRYQTQAPRPHDSRLDPNRYQTQAPRPHDSRLDPNRYQTQAPRPHDSQPDPNRYQTQGPRPHDSRPDPDRYQTQPTRPYYPRRDPNIYQTRPQDPERYTYETPTSVPRYPYPEDLIFLTTTPSNRYPAVTHRVYLQRGVYYGYYDEDGRFVVMGNNFDIERRRTHRDPNNIGDRERQTNRDSSNGGGRGRQDPHRDRYPVGERNRQKPVYPSPTPITFVRKLKAPSRFYFPKNYARIYGDKNHSILRKGKEFILSLRNSSSGWGVETPRALVALSLLNNSFLHDTFENSIILKNLQIFLGTNILRRDPQTNSLTRLALAVNSLLATCQDPKDFQGHDLTSLIRAHLRDSRGRPVSPAVHLSLCLADSDLDESHLVARLRERSWPDAQSGDTLALSLMAASCHLQRHRARDSDNFRNLESLVRNATRNLLDRMLDDGSFGSVYSTALAAQALLSVNDSIHWNPEQTLRFLKLKQSEDGSFGDFLATYWTLPVLSGRSLLHLRNTVCAPPKEDRDLTPSEILGYTGPKMTLRYSLYIGYPKRSGNSLELRVPEGINVYDVMRVAEHENEEFKFLYEEIDEQIHVYSISDLPNDSERGFEWTLYVKNHFDVGENMLSSRERISGDIREYYPRPYQHLIFWYHPNTVEGIRIN